METLTSAEKKILRSRAQRLPAVLQVGAKGVTEPFLQEMEIALERDRLVKLRFNMEREAHRQAIGAIEEQTGAVCVGAVGRTAAFYRKPKGKIDGEA